MSTGKLLRYYKMETVWLVLAVIWCLRVVIVHGASQEGLILQQLRVGFDDPSGAFRDWNEHDETPCKWRGIQCGPGDLVEAIDLSNANIVGPFPSVVCRLPALKNLSLANNYVNGSIPSDLGRCKSLELLDLSQNILVGRLPDAVSEIPNLRHIDLSANNFSGPIPPAFGRLPELRVLSLYLNLLDTVIPPFLGNLSNLEELNLAYNPLYGNLPPQLGNLTSLKFMWFAGCNLQGSIPESFGRLRNLENLDLCLNNLSGSIPDNITMLENVVQIELYENRLSGPLPAGLGNLTKLKRLDASTNNLSGPIPVSLGKLDLESLNLYQNNLEGPLPKGIGSFSSLTVLKLFSNRLTGTLPTNLGKNSPLEQFDIANNWFSGRLPPYLCQQKKLEILAVFNNDFSGPLPESLGSCITLTRVRIGGNRFSGPIPASLWSLPHLNFLEVKDNLFSGPIPPAIAGAENLTQLVINGNQFSGNIPSELGELSNLSEVVAGNNSFSGELPGSLGSLQKLVKLDFSGNNLTGKLLTETSWWTQLAELNLSKNHLSGSIPASLGALPVLNYLDLSENELSGEIPTEMGKLKLNILNLSGNALDGEIPMAFASAAYENSFLENPDLCGSEGFKGLKPCGVARHQESFWLLRCIFGLAGIILVLGLAFFYRRYRSFAGAEGKKEPGKVGWTLTSFHRLGFNEYEILNCLDEDNVIGSGGAGKVYKASLSNGENVAIKRLWNGCSKTDNSAFCDNGFRAEVETLGKIRHKNIVKLWCCCTNSDSRLLVYEYMPNGSLGDLLHGTKAGLLDWPIRYKIALGAAQGLAYLHHDCVPSIVHRDVKSNNILLDADYGARVADFGLAKILHSTGTDSMSAIAGSYGYIAPEYAYTLRVNEKSDIYSFGVVLLELVTGRRPVDPEFGENKDIVKWVCSKVEKKDGLQEVLDSKFVPAYKEEMAMVLKVGIICTSALPINRPSMRRVVELLLEATPHHRTKQTGRDGKLSPYYHEEQSSQDELV